MSLIKIVVSKSILSDTSVATAALFSYYLQDGSFLYAFIFNSFMFLSLSVSLVDTCMLLDPFKKSILLIYAFWLKCFIHLSLMQLLIR